MDCSFWWCGLRFANGANAPKCNCTLHFVLCLLAMSTALDLRKCYALASLFACGLPRLVANKVSVIASEMSLLTIANATRTIPSEQCIALLCANIAHKFKCR